MQTGGPQAWAEFCLAYCKRLTLFLAIPVTGIGCAARTGRFIRENGAGQSPLDLNWPWTSRTLYGFLRRFLSTFPS